MKSPTITATKAATNTGVHAEFRTDSSQQNKLAEPPISTSFAGTKQLKSNADMSTKSATTSREATANSAPRCAPEVSLTLGGAGHSATLELETKDTLVQTLNRDTPATASRKMVAAHVHSRSQDDNDAEEARNRQDVEELFEQRFGSISPIFPEPSCSSRHGSLSSVGGGARATNLRLKFRKSHTCGSLFANCNCSVSVPGVPLPIRSGFAAREAPSMERMERRQPFAALPPTMQLSLSPSSADVSASSGLGASLHSNSTAAESSRWLSGGSFSLSTNTNTSIQLSRDDEDFDDASGSTWPSLVGETYANSAHTASEESSRKSRAPRISTPTSLEVPAVSFSGSYASLPRTSSSSSNAQRKSRRLFQSYSHPDTDFVFTDENKKPSSDTNVLAHQQNTTAAPTASPSLEAVIISRDGRIARRHPKRSSSPNIGEYQTLDVAVHPDLLVKISPRHSPARSDRQHTGTPTSTAAAALSARSAAHQRRRWLQRSKEIESGGSTSDSEISADVKSPLSAVLSQSEKVAQPHNDGQPLKDSNLVKDETLNAAQRYFAESGILGPINPSNNLIRKTSKILQDSNVIEKIRKTSLILRGNQRKTSSTTTTTTTSYPSSTTQLNSPLLSCNDNNMELPTSIIYAQPTNSPKSPRSPHTVATTEFSPNLTTQSCCNMDDRDTVIKSLHGEMVSLKDVIKSRDAEILKLRREIHKLKSVLQQTTNHIPIAHDELLQSPTENKNRFQLSTQCRMVSSSEGDQNMRLSSTCTSCHRKLQPDDKIGDSNGSVSLDSTSDYITCSSTDSIPNNKANKQSANSEESNYNSTTKSSTKSASWTLAASNGSPHSSTEVASDAPVTKVTITSSNIVAKPKFLNLTAAPVLKKQGVSGESCETSMQQSINEPIPKFEKDFSSKQLIKDAIMDNDFLKNIDVSQVRELVESMYSLSVAKGEFVIREGEVGAHLYVSAEGEFEVVKNDKVLGIMGPGKAFGELAILYNCTRTASVRVLSDAQLWVLDRRVFQQIMMRTGMQRIENSVNFLKSVPLLKNLSEEVLAKIADVLEVEFYPAGTYIIRQGASGDTFFLISQGSVQVTQKLGLTGVEKEIRRLERGDYFGEQALINEDKRTANIIALAPGVECLTLDRESFTHLIGDLSELKEKSYDDESRMIAMKHADTREIFGANVKPEFPDMKLTDLEVVATLGLGGFGRVELVKAYHENHVETFALKCLKKRHIVDTKQEDHIFSERTIMLSCNSPFICRLYRTFRDEKYVYMLLEACMGGEIWTTLRDRGCFDENATQFIVGCVLQAFEYLHSRGIIYRDLKPENLMFNERGYVKLVDFGFSKYIGNSSKTWTFCGTPEYVAPEIILNKGHDRAVDYWALGILMHELLNGTPPFTSNDPMKTYNIILKGIDMIDFPKHMSRAAVQLIKKLCRDVPAERLGYQKGGIQDIKKHKWFLGFDWDGLQNQLLISPFVRPIAHPTDTCYFDRFPCDPNEPPDELSGWDADF